MENKYIKKIILFLLIILSIYVFFLIFPFIKTILFFILKILVPFLLSFVLAFILQPIVVRVQKIVKKRGIAVVIVLSMLVLIIYILIKTTIPYTSKEIKQLIENFPKITKDLEELVNNFSKKFDFLPIDYQPNFENLNTILLKYLDKLSFIIQNIMNKFLSYLSTIIIIPIILIYLLLEYEKVLCSIREYLIKNDKLIFKEYLKELNQKIKSYFKGTLLVMFILIIVCTILFMMIKLSYPLFFASIIAITNIIPYIGPYIGGVFPVVFALLSYPRKALLALVIVVIVQLIESNFLTPYIQSKNTENHPLLVILFLLIFEKLFGIIGMLIAVPILTILKTTLKYYPIKINIINKFIKH